MHDTTPQEIGPQHTNDDAFTRRMRLHQSWWRSTVLRVSCGVGPHATSNAKYGNMLAEDDGARGINFLTPEIADYALRRQLEFPRGIKRHRLLCNLLSSQPMCFNLFAPIAINPSIALPFVSAMFQISEVRRVVRVIVEHEPAPRSAFLGDATSFDAFIEVENADGELGFIAIETKLTEPFSQNRYPISEGSGYRRWIDHERSLWRARSTASLEALNVNQLFRDHALALAALCQPDSQYRFAALAVVRHPGDPACAASLNAYGELLRPTYATDVRVIDAPLDDVVSHLHPVVLGSRWESWLDTFNRRYVDLSGSAALALVHPAFCRARSLPTGLRRGSVPRR